MPALGCVLTIGTAGADFRRTSPFVLAIDKVDQ
jgi:hypothetical protein